MSLGRISLLLLSCVPVWGAARQVPKLPLGFEENQGQWGGQIRFAARSLAYDVELTSQGSFITTRERGKGKATVVRMKLVGARGAAAFEGLDVLPGKTSYFIGPDRSKWRTGIANYGRVRRAGIYEGVDLIYYGNERRLEHDFVVRPGADPSRIRMRFEGARPIRLNAAGDLVIETQSGELREERPRIYQEQRDGRHVDIAGGYRLHGREAMFTVGEFDRSLPLVIDPILWSTYLGGSQDDTTTAIDVDAQGNIYTTGFTASSNFPVTNGTVSSTRGIYNLFVTKISSDGNSVIYSAVIGGSNTSVVGRSLAVDANGNAYLAASAGSGAPTTGGVYQTAAKGTVNTYIVKLNAAATALIYATYVGGSKSDLPSALRIDAQGNAYVVGTAQSTDFPTTANAQRRNFGGGVSDAIVFKLDPSGANLLYSTYLGGLGVDLGSGLDVDAAGKVYVTGATGSPDFPSTPGAFQTKGLSTPNNPFGVISNVYVTKLDPTAAPGTPPLYSTFISGTRYSTGQAVRVDSQGNAYVTGSTADTDFPVSSGAYQTHNGGAQAVFVAKLNPQGSGLVWSTYLGGSGEVLDYGTAIDVDVHGTAFVTGYIGPQAITGGAVSTFGVAFSASFGDGGKAAFPAEKLATGSSQGNGVKVQSEEDVTSSPIAVQQAGRHHRKEKVVHSCRTEGNYKDDEPSAGGSGTFTEVLTPLDIQPVFGGGLADGLVSVVEYDETLPGAFASVSAASFAASGPVAPDSIVAGFGAGLAPSKATAESLPLPLTLNSTQVQVTDSKLATAFAPLFYVDTGQIDYLLPASLAPGAATISVTVNGATVASGTTQISRLAPGLFTANSSGKDAPAGQVLIVKSDGKQVTDLPYKLGAPGPFVPKPIDLSAGKVFLILYGTGFRNYSGGLGSWQAQVGGENVPVVFAGAQPSFAGLDQVNIGPLPNILAGKGTVNLVLTVEGQAANTVTVAFK